MLVIIVLVSVLAFCLLRIYFYRRQVVGLNQQLSRVLKGQSQSSIRNSGYSQQEYYLTKQINQLIQFNREIESRYRQLDRQNRQMIASISHDFRTPLTSMLGYVQMLQEPEHEKDRLRYLPIIEERINALANLIEDFYMLSLLDSGEYPLKREKMNPIVVLQNQLAMYYDDLQENFAQLDVEISEESLVLLGDQKIYERIYSNLIKNALNHGVGSCTIRGEVFEKTIKISFSNQLVEGVELDSEKLFDRTYKQDQMRSMQSTGLGLAIVKNLAEMIDCQLEATISDSQITFCLEIPR